MVTYISELSYSGGPNSDFVEIAVTTGTDISGYSIYTYTSNGSIKEGPISLGIVRSTVAGKDVYLINNSTPGFSNLAANDGLALVDAEGNVLQFLSTGGTVTATEGPASGMITTDIGTTTGSNSLQSDNGGTSYYKQTAPNQGAIPCYAPGTMIDTPDGPRPVQDLRPGDLVRTRDHGAQPIRWCRSGPQPLEDLDRDAKPVLLQAGALGPNRPSQDLIVSPQHRILIGGAQQLLRFFASEAFAPAKSLTTLPGIRHMMGKRAITWIHFACDRHEVVRANGCWSESLLLGPMAQQSLTPRDRHTLDAVLPDPVDPDYLNGPPARRCLRLGEVKRIISESARQAQAAA